MDMGKKKAGQFKLGRTRGARAIGGADGGNTKIGKGENGHVGEKKGLMGLRLIFRHHSGTQGADLGAGSTSEGWYRIPRFHCGSQRGDATPLGP